MTTELPVQAPAESSPDEPSSPDPDPQRPRFEPIRRAELRPGAQVQHDAFLILCRRSRCEGSGQMFDTVLRRLFPSRRLRP